VTYKADDNKGINFTLNWKELIGFGTLIVLIAPALVSVGVFWAKIDVFEEHIQIGGHPEMMERAAVMESRIDAHEEAYREINTKLDALLMAKGDGVYDGAD